MTDEERSLTLAGIDDAYCQQVGKLFGVLCSASEEEFDSGLAGQRFRAGLQRAMLARATALGAHINIDADPE